MSPSLVTIRRTLCKQAGCTHEDNSVDPCVSCPNAGWRADPSCGTGLGDLVERLVKPIAIALKLPCLDEQNQLRPESPCAKRRDALNRLLR